LIEIARARDHPRWMICSLVIMAGGDLTACQISIWFHVSVCRVKHVALYCWMIELEGVQMTLFCFVNLSYSGQNEQWESINI
jgi:hypothetical protein